MTGALRVVALLLTVASSALATGGIVCPNDDQFECIGGEVHCSADTGKCVCNDGFHGKKFLGCHPDSYDVCCIFNDPSGKTFGREPVGGLDIPVPCKYLIAHICVDKYLPGKTETVKCNYEIFAAEEKLYGKFFVSGFEFQLEYTIVTDIGSISGHFHARTYVDRKFGGFTYVLETRYDPSDPYDTVDLTQVQNALGAVTFGEQSVYYRVHLKIEVCSVELYFRAAVEGLGKDQFHMAGLTLGVNSDNGPKYKSLDKAFCLTSDKDVLTVGDVTNVLDMKEDHAFIYRALTGNYTQDFPNTAHGACSSIQQLAAECTDSELRMKGFEECAFILDEPHFVNCYATSSDSANLVALMEKCVLAYCQESNVLCDSAQDDIIASGCESKAPVEFTHFNCIFNLPPP